MDVLAGADFCTLEGLSWRGLATYYVLFFLHLESRRVSVAGITRHPDQEWMEQIARSAPGPWPSSARIITANAIIRAKATSSFSRMPQIKPNSGATPLSVASGSEDCSSSMPAPHEFLDHTGLSSTLSESWFSGQTASSDSEVEELARAFRSRGSFQAVTDLVRRSLASEF